ncbi:hypothetical protein PA598K_04249 [Paenibacillus sp. 598K]|uniref:tetratricopeptide repeat protein n=1 Tax=Paenibacillus sp. 598K TaxID=1117987 RepID=UPI000FFAE9ED|nr:tetratricopeptide repeat protein [Paenibacillus sp. 598K]GBF75817.1 hypothetical protein PA598K_04249 [Paenibacillus sp. 598K]
MPKLALSVLMFAVIIVVVGGAFLLHWLAGVAVVVLLVGYGYYSNRPMLYSMRANAAFMQGQEDKALALLEKTAALPNAGAQVLAHYGYLLLRKGELARAEQVFRDGLTKAKRREDEMQIKINLSTVYWLQHRREEALTLLEAIFNKFKNTMVYGNLGYLKLLSGQHEEALAFNLEAYDYNSEDQTIRDNLAQTYYMLGRYEEAEEMYKQVIAKSPKFAEPYYYYARTLKQLGKVDEAREQCEAALGRPAALIPSTSPEEVRQLAAELDEVPAHREEQTE